MLHQILSKAAFFVLLLGAMLFSRQVKAQKMDVEAIKKSTPEQRAGWQDKIMKEKLSLTDKQIPQVSKLNLDYPRKLQPLLTSTDARLFKAMKLRSIMKEKNGKLKAVLTDEQYTAYEQMVKENTEAVKEAYIGN